MAGSQRIAHALHEAAAPYARGPWIAAAAVACVAGIGAVSVAQLRFAALSGGAHVPDLALFSGPQALYERIAAYGAEGRAFYRWFFVADFLYPLTAGVLCALLVVSLTRASHAARWEWLVLLPVAATGADWIENAFLVVLVCAFPQRLGPLAITAAVLTVVKFALIGATALALAGLTLRWTIVRRQRRARPSDQRSDPAVRRR